MRGPICKGEGREEREGKGRKGEWKEKGKGVPGATIFHLHPCSTSRSPSGGKGALHPAGGLAPHPQLLLPLPSDPGDATEWSK